MPDRQHIHFPAESDAEDISTRLIELFENLDGVDSRELPPLYESIDPDALAELIDSQGRDMGYLRIEFEYLGHLITVYRDGKIVLEPLDQTRLQS